MGIFYSEREKRKVDATRRGAYHREVMEIIHQME